MSALKPQESSTHAYAPTEDQSAKLEGRTTRFSETTLLDVAEDLGLRSREPFQIRLELNDLVARLEHERDAARRSAEATQASLRAALLALHEQLEWSEVEVDINAVYAELSIPLEDNP